MQIDVHGPNSAENAQVISTIFRSGFAVTQMAASGVTPLYSEDPRQAPFTTAADQFEDRWVIEAHLQIDPIIAVPQAYADSTSISLTSLP